jgi:predicted nucleotidyltransferase
MNPPAWTPEHGTLILQAVGGSRAYGLETATSDWDWRGVYVADPKLVFSLNGPPHYVEKAEPDVHYWEIQHFLKYALAGNPTCLELLWSKQLLSHWWGSRLLDIRDAFISKNCIKAYEGFATAQWARLQKVEGEWGPKEHKLYMHMCRLMLSLRNILLGDGPLVEVGGWAPLLTKVRNGGLPSREFISLHQGLLTGINRMGADSLPKKPQYQTAEDFLLWVRLAAAKKGFALHE